MPRLMIRCGATPAISSPSNSIPPAVGGSVPDSMLKMVLLPEPFGPIRPRISPRSTLNDTLLTAVKPPKRFLSPLTTSTAPSRKKPDASLVAERRPLRQRQHGLALHLALRPNHIGFVIDILQHHRERALVLPGKLRAFAEEFHPVAEHGAAFRDIGIESGLAQRIRIDAAILLDCARQDVVEEYVGVGGADADMGG